MNIFTIPDEELERDRKDSIADIDICRAALSIGYHTHRDGLPVQERIDGNQKIIAKIEAERARRKVIYERTTCH